MRESCYEYLRVILSHWPKADMERYAPEMLVAINTGLADASAAGRKTSRQCFVLYRRVWPDAVERCVPVQSNRVLPGHHTLLLLCASVYALLDVRTQRLIESADVAPPKIDLVRTHHHLSAAHGSRGTPVAHGCSRGGVQERRVSVEDGAAAIIQAVVRGKRVRASVVAAVTSANGSLVTALLRTRRRATPLVHLGRRRCVRREVCGGVVLGCSTDVRRRRRIVCACSCLSSTRTKATP